MMIQIEGRHSHKSKNRPELHLSIILQLHPSKGPFKSST